MPSSVAVGVEGRSIRIETLDMSSADAAGASGERGGGGSRSGVGIGWANGHVLFSIMPRISVCMN